MAKPLIIVESPNKAPHIAEYSGMDCMATYGHFGDLPDKALGVNLETYELTFEYKAQIVRKILELAKGRDVYVAGDPDREGFAISSMAAAQVQRVPHGILRLLEIHSIDKKGIAEAMAKAIPWEKANHNREKAFRARRGVDRLIGYILSPLASAHFGAKGYSVGRVQAPALRILVDRAREIQNFKPVAFWRVLITATCGEGPEMRLEYAGGRFAEQGAACALMAKIQIDGARGRVTAIQTKTVTKNPPPPFTMSTLTQKAHAGMGLAIKETASLAQGLFEAGFITYPRTDSVRIEAEPLEAIRAAIAASLGAGALPEKPNAHVSKNSQADAHEAIRPTRFPALAELPGMLDEIKKAGMDQAHCDLFMLIYVRTLASQMRPEISERTTVEAEFAGEIFKAAGSVQKEPGFTKIYEDAPGDDEEKPQPMPRLAEGQMLQKAGEELAKGETKPPAYHTEGSLVAELEKKGIGRPSTYGPSVEVLKIRGYAELGTGKQKKCLLPTTKGCNLIDWLAEAHPWIIDYAYTAELEAKLDQVEAGELPWKEVMREVHARLGFADPRNTPRAAAPQEARESLGQCPKCSGPVHEGSKFFGCANWHPDKGGCDFKIWVNTLGGKITAPVVRDLLAGKQTRAMKLKSKEGKPYEARLTLKDGRVAPVFGQ